jgi:hypothetical protein
LLSIIDAILALLELLLDCCGESDDGAETIPFIAISGGLMADKSSFFTSG